jgi:heme oxygenase
LHNHRLSQLLKQTTTPHHIKVQKLPFFLALVDGTLSLSSVLAQLQAMSIVHGVAEEEAARAEPTPITACYLAQPSRASHLLADLATHAPLGTVRCPPKVASLAHQIADQLRAWRVKKPAAFTAAIYVLWGTTLGNWSHVPDVQRLLGGKDMLRYYRGYGSQTATKWGELTRALDGLDTTMDDRAEMQQAVARIFELLEQLFLELHPLADEAAQPSGFMLNPVAGTYPIPDDPVEIEASLAAARAYMDETPYIERRYGEKGRRYTESDTAWLATLCELPLAALLQQLNWIARLRAGYGMPTHVTERQVELLVDALLVARPDRADRYQKLRDAASEMKNVRLSRLNQQQTDELLEQFEREVSGLPDRLENCGILAISAVIDELAGTESSSRLNDWLLDPERFSPAWIAAVKTLERQTRERTSIRLTLPGSTAK